MSFYSQMAAISVSISLISTLIYLRTTWRGTTKPHIFSWFVWGLVTAIGAAISFTGGAIENGLAQAVAATMDFLVVGLSLRGGTKNITRGDWAALFAALSAIPLWLVTDEPLTAAILISGIDVSGVFPTVRKAWNHPHEESAASFSLFAAGAAARVLSVAPFTLTNSLYSFALLFGNGAVVLLLLARRTILRKTSLLEGAK